MKALSLAECQAGGVSVAPDPRACPVALGRGGEGPYPYSHPAAACSDSPGFVSVKKISEHGSAVGPRGVMAPGDAGVVVSTQTLEPSTGVTWGQFGG